MVARWVDAFSGQEELLGWSRRRGLVSCAEGWSPSEE